MKYENGEIEIAPKTIFWIEIPGFLDEKERIELLKRDIFIVEFDGLMNNIKNLTKSKSKYTAYFYNLEDILIKNKVKKDEIYSFSVSLAAFINSFIPERSLIHTNFIDEKLANLFRQEGITFVEKNLKDKKNAYSTIVSMIMPFFSENQKILRSSLRLNLLSKNFNVDIVNLDNKDAPIIHCIVKNLSLNGVCFFLQNNNELNFFNLKDRLQVCLYLTRNIIKIDLCFVTRIDKNSNEIGVTFNLTDGLMIRDDYSNILTSMIYNWMKTLIDKYGNIDTE